MRDMPVNAYAFSAEAGEEHHPSFTRGLLWGGALSVPLWALIGWVASRGF